MKYILGSLIAIALVGLSYISIHAYEDINVIRCDIPGSASAGLLVAGPFDGPAGEAPLEIVKADAGAQGAALIRRAGRRSLKVPAWALGG